MAKTKSEFVEQVALEYWLNGETLTRALNKAQADWKASHKRARAFSEKEAKSSLDRIESLTKQSKNRLLREEKMHDKKVADNKVKEAKRANDRIEADARKSAEKQARAKKKSSVTGGFENFGGRIGTIASYGAAIVVLNSLRQAITFAVTKAIELEKAFTDLTVKSGFSNREMTKVADAVIQVASATQFSTLEIVGAATALGKLGFEAEEVIKILPQVGNVAAATGETLQATAEVFGKVINAYSFSADSALNVADRLVDVFNNSALNLEKFNTAFSYVGSAAASTGTSFNELTAAMAVLSDRGITASKIGTGLRNVFTKMGEEGDSLRNILQRINDAHLSFYEVAELVGRRAANQLFIMANSLDEFDANVARSADQFGESMKAAATQMDTFSAKWDILINTITNTLIPEFDADETFRDSLKDRISLLDELNILIDTTGKNKNNKVSGILAQLPDFRKEFEAARASLDSSLSDREILKELIRIEDENSGYNSLLSTRWGNQETEYAKGLRELRLLLDDDENLLTDNIFKYNEAEAKSKVDTYVTNFEILLKQAISGIDVEQGNEKRNTFLDGFLFGGNQADAKKVLKDQLEFGKLTTEQYLQLIEGFGTKQGEWVDKVRKQYERYEDVNLLEAIAKGYESERDTIRRINNGDDELTNKTDANNEANILKRIEKRKAFLQRMCDIDPKFVLDEYGFVCEENKKGRTKKAQIDRFEKNVTDEADYLREKDRLSKQFSSADDPLVKADLNNQLVRLEKTYRANLNEEYKTYLDKQASLYDDFARKYPDQADAFKENISKTQANQVKDETSGIKNLNTYDNRSLDAEAQAFKESELKKAQYVLKMSELDLKLRSTDRRDRDERKRILDDKNKLTKDYYADAEKDLSLWAAKLEVKLEELNELNRDATFGLNGESTVVDTTKLKDEIARLNVIILELRAKANKGTDSGNKFDREDYDLFPDIVEAYDNIYNVISEAGDRKLELLKEQNARELEEIQGRYDSEAGIINASLEAGIISEEQATEAEERIRRKKIDNENKTNKKLFEAQKKKDKQDAIFLGISSTAQAVANAFAKNLPPVAIVMAAISAAAIAGSTANNIAAISKRKFVPQKYAEGGLIEGRPHSQGGVPFSVSGYNGFEAEGGEFIVNKEATKRHLSELERINGKAKSGKRKFATGGIVSTFGNNDGISEAILEALNRPVRAFVTDQDLAKSETERNALTAKTSF